MPLSMCTRFLDTFFLMAVFAFTAAYTGAATLALYFIRCVCALSFMHTQPLYRSVASLSSTPLLLLLRLPSRSHVTHASHVTCDL